MSTLQQSEQHRLRDRPGREKLFTYRFKVVSFVGVFVEEEVVACRIFGDSHWQVLHLCWFSVAQANQLLFGVYFLSTGEIQYKLTSKAAGVSL